MPTHLATVALAAAAAASPAHSAHAFLARSPHVAPPRPAAPLNAPAAAKSRSAAGRPRAAAHAAGGDPGVTIADFHFTAPTTTIHVGDTITWTNDGPSPHTATARDGSFDTGTLNKGQSATHTFTRAGTFAYVCKIHPFMHGTIVVVASATSAPGSTTTAATPPAPHPAATQTTASPTTASPTTATQTTATQPASTAQTQAESATAKPALPVTGIDLVGSVAVGAILFGAGLALRRAVGP